MSTPEQNPANTPTVAEAPARRRIPMSTPRRKLEVPEIPGYHLYWFVDRNVQAAIQAGYDFVNINEVPVNSFNVANPVTANGSTDLGDRVRILGGTAEGGGAENLWLMKIREEWYLEDRKELEKVNARIVQAIFTDEDILGEDGQQTETDKNLRYVKSASMQKPILNRPPKKVRS